MQESLGVSEGHGWKIGRVARGRTACSATVIAKQCPGVMSGRTAKTVSPTKPRVELETPSGEMDRLRNLVPTAIRKGTHDRVSAQGRLSFNFREAQQ